MANPGPQNKEVLQIPAHPFFSSLNLIHAVAITAYYLRGAFYDGDRRPGFRRGFRWAGGRAQH